MHNKFFQSMLFAFALIFIAHPTNVTADEPVQQDPTVHQDDIDIVKGKPEKQMDVVAIEEEVNNFNADSITKLAQKMYPEARKDYWDIDKVVDDIRNEIEENHPESLAELDALATYLQKCKINQAIKDSTESTHYIEISTCYSPKDKAEVLANLNRENEKLKTQAPNPNAEIEKQIKWQQTWKHEVEMSTELSPVEKSKRIIEIDTNIEKLRKKMADPHANVNSIITSLIDKWNGGPSGPLVKAMQVYVIKNYRLKDASLDQYKNTPLDDYEAHVESIGLIIDAMKNLTHKTLKEKGITHLTLYRGLKLHENMTQKVHTHRLSGLSSFSLSLDTARNFATAYEPGHFGYVLAKQFPIDRILSFWGTGLGTHCELEMIVLGPKNGLDKFYVIKRTKPEYNHEYTQPGQYGGKKPFHKWVDYGHQKAVDKKDLQIQAGKKEEPVATNIPKEAKETKQVSKSGVLAFLLEVLEAIFTFMKDVVCQLIAFIKSLF